MAHKLTYKDKISRRKSMERIVAHASYGIHGNSFRPKSGKELQQYFINKGIDTDRMLEDYRDIRRSIPEFQNLLVPNFLISEGASIKVIDKFDGEIIYEVKGPGEISLYPYNSKFDAAQKAKNRSVEQSSVWAFYESLSLGVASIDTFIDEIARDWNKRSSNKLNLDQRLSIENKIDNWIPKITNGNKINKGGKDWQYFKILKRIRNQKVIHSSSSGDGLTFNELAKCLNMFRQGIAHFLGNLHLKCGKWVPSNIIDSVYYPDVIVVECDDDNL